MNQNELQQLSEAVQAFKSTHTDLIAQVKQYGQASGDTQAKLDALNERLNEIETGVKEIQGARNRKGRDIPSDPGSYPTDRKNFIEALRKGMSPAEAQAKGLTLGTDTAGGFLAPGTFVDELIKGVVENSPIRSIARVTQISGPNAMIPKRTQTAAATWVGEVGTRSETQLPAYGLENIPTHELHAMAKISQTLLEDSHFDMDAELRMEFADQFALSEGAAFVSGNGTAKPEGFLVATAVQYSLGGHASTLTADGVLGISFDIKVAYMANARYVFNRSTLKAIRQLKDSQNQYLWNPGLNGLTQPQLCGYPYTLAEDMPSVSANLYPIAFGDFARGYRIIDRVQMGVIIDPFSSKSTGQVEFSARRRVGGQVVLPEAIRLLKVAAS